ncbi:hypothetical protein GUITHDRAFT_148540 [Guillardia theta CCMP2712]|uniref:Uncharacterized protein n=1 Tax=Guillardia theta (strain CCMP2712) TaxID=905079 RepID=L1I9H1_GUITC|nr:hypothetical protein GUITHDRAFT_148540 [Guillardia theta CCMP2712]EKX32554.1 hypothetical protein GUITHDRAFT_148540 [Guillardia theta CCMP2712]|eukprot:XP_005819534.1 hypothetical protein GUITHDRAFT_148540 [Guillardia theta CCMP2712]
MCGKCLAETSLARTGDPSRTLVRDTTIDHGDSIAVPPQGVRGHAGRRQSEREGDQGSRQPVRASEEESSSVRFSAAEIWGGSQETLVPAVPPIYFRFPRLSERSLLRLANLACNVSIHLLYSANSRSVEWLEARLKSAQILNVIARVSNPTVYES